jgi:hypothetical protein
MTLPNIIMGTPYSQTLQATGGASPYTWSFVVGNTSPFNGITVSSSGVFGGTAVSPGCTPNGCSASFGIQVSDATGRTANRTYTLLGIDPLSITSSGALANTNVGNFVGYTLETQGGIRPLTWSVNPNSSLPPGTSLQLQGPTHVIGGMPLVPGSYSFELTVADSGTPQQTASQTFSVTVENNLNVVGENLPTGLVQQAYAYSFRTFGGAPPYSYSLTPGDSLPAGLSIDSQTGQVIGIPSQGVTNHFFNVQVTDSGSPPALDSALFGLTIRPPLAFSTSPLPDGVQGQTYSGWINIVGGLPPFDIRIVSASLPAGLAFDVLTSNSGVFPISGVPMNVEQASFDLEVTDSSVAQIPVTQAFTLRVNPLLVLNTSTLPEGIATQPYAATIGVSGGLPPYAWTLVGWVCGSPPPVCPPSVTLDPTTGLLSGTPIEEIQVSLVVRVHDSSVPWQFITPSLTFKVAGLLRFTSLLPPVRVGQPVFLGLGASGGTPPYSFNFTSGSLPLGLSMNSLGEITGTASTATTTTFTVTVTDSSTTTPQSRQQTLQLMALDTLGRNDTITTATPLSNGRYAASLSPADDAGAFVPDSDYYRITADAGAVVTIETFADRLASPSVADTVIEIVDASGTRFLAACSSFTSGPFGAECWNDDKINAQSLDSFLRFLVPGTPGTPVTFYVRVLDWSGDARPDFRYEISISGAN